ncbi:carboxypeptidase regulatory-like domain-containing protein [candidate division WOR-3 bacterium]|nr:carboxypeptidase regulatory-like domain-containing protein [candidate division WOR-3 bacterium]
MKRIGVIVGYMVLLTGVIRADCGITGFVTDDQGSPLLGALVSAHYTPFGGSVGEGYTDSAGIYTIYLPPGVYYAYCYKDGYIPEWWDDHVSPQGADPIFVDSMGVITSDIDFELSEDNLMYGYIEGAVTDESSGYVISSALITFYIRGSYFPIASTFSDTDGYYIDSLPVNDVGYLVKADKVGYEEEWYLESSTQDSATLVTVEEGETTSDIDFTLMPSTETGSINGYVICNDSLFLDAVLFLYTDYWGMPVDTTVTNYGFYNFGDVEPGTYYVFCDAGNYGEMWWDNESNPEDADPIDVFCGETVWGINFFFGTQSDGRTVAGWVFDEATGLGIRGAGVIIHSAYPPGDSIMGYTDFYGRYVINGVPADSLFAMAWARGYFSEWYYESDGFDGAAAFIVPEGEVVDNINFTLAPDTIWLPGSISGQVTTTEGIPILNAWVTAYTGGYVGGISQVDSGGFYMIEDLLPGSYYVVASAFGFYEEWYEESPSPQGAAPVEVTAGENHGGIDFTLESMETGTVTGRVIDTDSIGIPRAYIWAEGIDNWSWGYAVSDVTGDYIMELEPGFYSVSAYADGYEMGTYPELVEVIVDQITPNIDIVLEEYNYEEGTISGQVLEDTTYLNPIQGALVMTFSIVPNNIFFGYAFTDENGEYVIENVPVVYCECYYVVALSEGYIPEFYDNVYTYEEATPVAAFAENIDFSLGLGASGPRGISGRVLEGKSGVSNALAFAMEGSEVVAAAVTLSDGSYRIRELPPSVYTIMVTAVGYETTSFPYPVDVTTNNVSGVDVNLDHLGVEEEHDIISTLILTVAPNPTRMKPTISFTLPKDCEVSISLHDISGRVVKEIASGFRHAGVYTGETVEIEDLPGGIYFVRLKAGKSTLVNKVVILR